MYTVVGSTGNRTFRVIWTLEELGLAYDQVKAAPGSEGAKTYSTTGKVPALVVAGTTYTDSVAIMRYLSDKHNTLTFPAGSLERLTMDSHIEFLNEEFDGLLWTAGKNSFVNPTTQRCADIKPILKWEFERSLQRFEQRLDQNEFLMGDQFTIADILAVHLLNWSRVAKFPAATDRIKTYAKSIRQRPAYQRVMETL